jgi:rod shape-determining protein MreC
MTGRRAPQRLIVAIIVVAVAVPAVLFFRGALLRLFSFAEKPLSGTATWLTDRTIAYCEALEADEDVSKLKEERDLFALKAAELEQFRDENGQLRDELNFVDRRNVRAIAASVVSRELGDRSSSFVIDRGSADGVVPGMAIVVGEGILVGKVNQVTQATATVTSTSDPRTATAVTLLNQTRTLGLAEGMNGSLISLQYIPNDETMNVNDLVVTSGLEENMISGLLVGVVNQVESDASAPFQKAIVEPLADVRRFSSVLVIIQGNST